MCWHKDLWQQRMDSSHTDCKMSPTFGEITTAHSCSDSLLLTNSESQNASLQVCQRSVSRCYSEQIELSRSHSQFCALAKASKIFMHLFQRNDVKSINPIVSDLRWCQKLLWFKIRAACIGNLRSQLVDDWLDQIGKKRRDISVILSGWCCLKSPPPA